MTKDLYKRSEIIPFYVASIFIPIQQKYFNVIKDTKKIKLRNVIYVLQKCGSVEDLLQTYE